jgi:DNA-binding CsgD family transcriptional regulator
MESIQLTYKEVEILRQVSEGKTNFEISKEIGIEEDTVKSHLQNINDKLRTKNRTDAVITAIRMGIITIKAE